MVSTESIAAYVRDRDAALRSLDAERIVAFVKQYGLDGEMPQLADPTHRSFWPAIHKARAQLRTFSHEEREASNAWLREHGYREEVIE